MQTTPLENSSADSHAFVGRPSAFHVHYLVAEAIAYRFVEPSGEASPSGGVLKKGQSVWLEDAIERNRLSSSIHGYVEQLGLVLINPRWLKKADGFV